MSSLGLDDVCRLAEARTGWSIDGTGDPTTRARLGRARDASGCRDWSAFANRLAGDDLASHAWKALIHHLSSNETSFFRNQPHTDLLREQVLPALIRRRAREAAPWLRIWSAGCATGEETYSLAILIRQLIPDLERWSISILGTDINTESLRQARIGIYSPWSIRDDDSTQVARYSTRQGSRLMINDEIVSMVRFATLNLVGGPSYGSHTSAIDLILCRNVARYLNEHARPAVAKRLLHSLTPGGWLIVAPSEADAKVFAGFETVSAHGAVAFRRPRNRTELVEAASERPASSLPMWRASLHDVEIGV